MVLKLHEIDTRMFTFGTWLCCRANVLPGSCSSKHIIYFFQLWILPICYLAGGGVHRGAGVAGKMVAALSLLLRKTADSTPPGSCSPLWSLSLPLQWLWPKTSGLTYSGMKNPSGNWKSDLLNCLQLPVTSRHFLFVMLLVLCIGIENVLLLVHQDRGVCLSKPPLPSILILSSPLLQYQNLLKGEDLFISVCLNDEVLPEMLPFPGLFTFLISRKYLNIHHHLIDAYWFATMCQTLG